MNAALSRRYARAVLELAQEQNALDAVGSDLGRAADVFSDPRLRAVVLNPGIDAGARKRIVREVVMALGVSATVSNTVRLLADRDRLPILSDIARSYDALVDEVLGRTRVRIRTASALGAAERTALTELARRIVGKGEVLVSSDVDPELIGGVVLDVAGTVYDGSVRTQLARIGRRVGGEGA